MIHQEEPPGQSNEPQLYAHISKSFYSARGHQEFGLRAVIHFSAGVTILFGRSGAGKSTLLDCISGVVEPDAGTVVLRSGAERQTWFDSPTAINLPPWQRHVGYIFQKLALFPHMNVLKNVEYGLAHLPGEARRDRSIRLLESFRVEKLIHRMPDEISGGERQRVAFARALVTEPRVLLLDEPLSAIDAWTKFKILDDLREWNASRQIPILYVTHSRSEAARVGDRVISLDAGTISEGLPVVLEEVEAVED